MNTHKNSGFDALDRVVARIAKRSRRSGLKQSNQDLIDHEILKGYADPDEIANEDRIEAHPISPFLRADASFGDDGREWTDFRDAIDFHIGDCKCGAGEECQICCTDADFAALAMFPSAERGPVIGRDPAGRESFFVSLSRDELDWRGMPN